MRSIKYFCCLIFSYLLLAVLFGFVSINNGFAQSNAETAIKIMVINNGVHSDLVLPVKTNIIDWRKHLNPQDYAGADSGFTHIALGWGSRQFYMETPEWKDLKLSVAFGAALGLGKSAMHVYYLPKQPQQDYNSVPIYISPKQYQELVHYVLQSFQTDKNKSFLLISGKGYSKTDNFYEANGVYSVLKPCNAWTNSALKAAGIETVLWAPVPHFMMRKLRKYAVKQKLNPALSLSQSL